MKLANQVFLLIVSALLVAVVAMSAFFAFNLERGFVGYINSIQLTHFEALHQALVQEAVRQGSLDSLFRDRRRWNRFVRETETGRPPRELEEGPRPPPPFRGEEGPRPPFPPKGERGPPPPGNPLGLGTRFILLDAERRPLPGEPLPPVGGRAPLERAIQVDGRTVGWLRHTPFERVSRPEELAFLREQFQGLLVVALGLLLAGFVAAPFIARRWTRPLRQIGWATERIARGEFRVRIEGEGADEIGQLTKNVNAMAQALAELEAARKRWIAESAHELRTPLAVLRGEIEALQDGVRPLDAKAIASLAEESRRLTKLVNDLHLLALADFEGLPCVMARVDLASLVQRVAERFRIRAAQRGITLAIDVPATPLELDADDDRLAQLLTNLLENSIRYTDAPGRIEVTVARQAQAIVLTVEDTAPGVGAQECERLFEPLYKADAARSRREGGSGLGLAICRAIARAHGGTATAQPSRLGGLAVGIHFPAAA